jgi:hypothetical protein
LPDPTSPDGGIETDPVGRLPGSDGVAVGFAA